MSGSSLPIQAVAYPSSLASSAMVISDAGSPPVDAKKRLTRTIFEGAIPRGSENDTLELQERITHRLHVVLKLHLRD